MNVFTFFFQYRKVLKNILILAACIFEAGELNAQSPALKAYWKDRLRFETTDGSYKFSVGGRLHYDAAFLRHSLALDTLASPVNHNVKVRRARLSFEGKLKNLMEYEFEFTFGETIEFADLYVAFLKIPFIERLTIGHFREPFGMEENTSSNAIVFMERSMISSFGPGRNAGIMIQKKLNDKLRIYTGAFRITDDLGSDEEGDSNHSFASRIAYVPLSDTTKNKLLHTGLSFNIFKPKDTTYQLNTENEAHSGATYLRSGKIKDVNKVMQFGAEIGYTLKKLTLQGEAMYSITQLNKVNGSLVDERARSFHGYYASASYFITGGSRSYDHGGNEFSSISVENDENDKSLKGAWEVGLRYSHINLRESVSELKMMSDITVGLNWYMNASSRLMFNYIYSRIQNRYYANAFQCRLQLTF